MVSVGTGGGRFTTFSIQSNSVVSRWSQQRYFADEFSADRGSEHHSLHLTFSSFLRCQWKTLAKLLSTELSFPGTLEVAGRTHTSSAELGRNSGVTESCSCVRSISPPQGQRGHSVWTPCLLIRESAYRRLYLVSKGKEPLTESDDRMATASRHGRDDLPNPVPATTRYCYALRVGHFFMCCGVQGRQLRQGHVCVPRLHGRRADHTFDTQDLVIHVVVLQFLLRHLPCVGFPSLLRSVASSDGEAPRNLVLVCFQMTDCCAITVTFTMHPEINSNDFGCFWNYLVDSNSKFVVVEMVPKYQFEFFVCSEFIHTQCDITVHVLWLVFETCVDVSPQMQTHSRQTHITLPFQLWLCPG